MRALIALLLDWWHLVRSPRARPYLLITLLVDGAFIFVFLVAIQSYLPEGHHVGASLPGYALAVYGAAKLAAQLFAGRLIDYSGRKQGLLCGLVLILVGQVGLLGAAAAPAAVFPAAAVYGMGAAVLWPAVYALASGAFDAAERARFTSAMMLTTGLALMMALGLGFVLPPSFPYAAAAALALAIIVVAVAFAAGSRAEETQRAGPQHALPTGTLSTVMKDILQPQRLAFGLIVLLQATAVGALLAIFRSYGRDFLSVSLREEALILAPAALLAAGAVAAGGALGDRFGRSRLLAAGYLVAAPALLILSSVTTPGVVVPAAAMGGVGLGLALPSITATSMDLSHTAGQGTLLSWFMALEGLGHAAGPALGGLMNSAGGTEAVLRLVGVLFAVMAATAVALSLALTPRALSLALTPRGATVDAHREGERLLVGRLEDSL
jgi:MFS family permease